jgi:hypothetical protein
LATSAPASEWALHGVLDLTVERRWDVLWQVLVSIARRDDDIAPEVLAVVAAGPLEDLVCKAGPDFIDRIEREAKLSRRFGFLLTGVWPSRATPEIRERVLKFCRAFPGPMDGTYRF